jgi:hypothetical protein
LNVGANGAIAVAEGIKTVVTVTVVAIAQTSSVIYESNQLRQAIETTENTFNALGSGLSVLSESATTLCDRVRFSRMATLVQSESPHGDYEPEHEEEAYSQRSKNSRLEPNTQKRIFTRSARGRTGSVYFGVTDVSSTTVPVRRSQRNINNNKKGGKKTKRKSGLYNKYKTLKNKYKRTKKYRKYIK